MSEFNEVEYKNEYSKKNYDRILFALPKGYRDKIKVRTNELEISMAEYIKNLIDQDLKNNQ